MTSNIEWLKGEGGIKGDSWNAISGCWPVAPGCANCYAARMAATRLKHTKKYQGLAVMKDGVPHWTGEVRCYADDLLLPLHSRKAKRWFVASMSDPYHEAVPFDFLDKIYAVMSLTPQHTYILLTKRPARRLEYMTLLQIKALEFGGAVRGCGRYGVYRYAEAIDSNFRDGKLAGALNSTVSKSPHIFHDDSWPISNVIEGISISNEKDLDRDGYTFIETPAAVRMISYEPALGPVDFSNVLHGVHIVVYGPESGPGARPHDLAWARDALAQCRDAGVKFYMKQITDKKGRKIPFDEWPEDLKIREWPEGLA